MRSPTLVIGNKNYSAWSLRAWLYLKQSGVSFTELRIPMFTEEGSAKIAQYSPTKRVPVLIDGDISVWDSFSIVEYVREQFPHAVGWPADTVARAYARSISFEMHSGFLAIREELPFNVRARMNVTLSDTAQTQVERVRGIWRACRERYRDTGPWLFGEFSLADVMFAPVALRFISYNISLGSAEQEFVASVRGLPAIQEWGYAAEREEETIALFDERRPLRDEASSLG